MWAYIWATGMGVERMVSMRPYASTRALICTLICDARGAWNQPRSTPRLMYDSTSTLDPYVQVLMPDGKTILEEDDDGGMGMESEVRFDLPVSGTYYIVVTDDRIHEDPDYTNSDFTNLYRLDLTRR